MPSRTNTSTATAAPAPAASKKFELPALEFKFASLTDGTDIPPPLPSPIAEEPEAPAAKGKTDEKEAPAAKGKQEQLANGASKANGNHATTTSTSSPQSRTATTKAGLKRPAEDSPASPTLSSRQGSIRRLFSRNLLHSAYANGEGEAQGHNSMDAGSVRPVSQSNGSIMDDRKAKRSSGWFRRLRGDGTASKRSSFMAEEPKKPAGPPPPMIPELSDLEAKVDVKNVDTWGNDLFKDIK